MVIAVIAILMAVLMPALTKAREQGKRAVCFNNLKQLTLAWTLYADDNSGRLVNGMAGLNRVAGGTLTESWKDPKIIERAWIQRTWDDYSRGTYLSAPVQEQAIKTGPCGSTPAASRPSDVRPDTVVSCRPMASCIP